MTSSSTAPAAVGPPDLQDTATAFAHQSDADLRRAYWLFRVIGNPTVSALGKILSELALFLHLPVKGLIKSTIFRQFCGGETIAESLHKAEELRRSGIGTILDHSVEGQDEEDELDATVVEVLRTIQVARERGDIPFCVFKTTGISRTDLLELVSSGNARTPAEEEEWSRVEARMEKLCASATEARVPLLIDAEESWLQPAIDALVERMMERFNREHAWIFHTIQLYRHDRSAYLHMLHDRASREGFHIGMKLVRGAYMEKERERATEKGYPSPIHADKAAVDRDYDAAIAFCVANRARISVMAGTHNEKSSLLLARLLDENGIARNDPRTWFAQLLGMSDHISYNLAAAGYRVAKYVPYGPVREVLPYLIRRAAENTSVAGQTGRELGLIGQERLRRAAR
ncbi:MAG: proline dehydrogenase family protein [Flavobacteriales bacterium]|nr:proline dehydrogenase family protein [Flavobacteriales bacterium]MCB9167518.1 proline dehydrogenase family protein [Flavobacteriales bacterium]